MAYVKKIYDLGKVIQVEKYYPANYGAPGKPRQKKQQRTPEDIERQNRTNREKKIQRLILANFKEGDWHLILTYKKELRPEGTEEAKAQIQKFLKDMRREFKKAGYDFKYIYVTEKGKRGAWHHHLIIEDISDQNMQTTKLVQKYWPHGHPQFYPLYEDGNFEDLAEYIVKKETKEEKGGCTYSRSRNLIIPEPKREIIHHKRWRTEPKPPAGWEIKKGSLINGINPVTGYPFQHYDLVRIGGG